MREQDLRIIAQFRAEGGLTMGQMDVLLLHHTGAKSELDYVTPLSYVMQAGDWIIIAGNSGLPTNPGWYFNLKAFPLTEIEVGAATIPVTATEITGDERDAVWAELCASRPDLAGFQNGLDRVIPLFRLTPR
ncbi:MAG TPA: nitroreductase/quinone reductase family protein [Thermomicrobiales bacterium]|nr:nitroreductase/quinone reductase family protein [Thermomicrobiales bacterium]